MIQWFPTGVVQVLGTTAALSLRTLMNTASAGKWDAAALLNPNVFYINPEWTIRLTLDWWTPTATVGLELDDKGQYTFEGNIDNIKLINAQLVNIMCWRKIPW